MEKGQGIRKLESRLKERSRLFQQYLSHPVTGLAEVMVTYSLPPTNTQ